MKVISIGGVNEAFNIPWKKLCSDKIFSEQYSLQLKWQNFDGGTGQLMRAVNNGEIDMAIALTEGAVFDIVKFNKSCLLSFYVTSPLEWGIHVSKYSDIYSPNEIKGKKVAVSRLGSGSHIMPALMANEMGWDAGSLIFHESLNLMGGISDLMKKNADVFFWEKHTTAPYIQNNNLRCIGSYFSKWPAFSVIVNRQKWKLNEKEFIIILKSVFSEAQKFSNSLQSVSEVSEHYQMKENTARQWLAQTTWANQPLIEQEQLVKVSEALYNAGLISTKPNAAICSCL